MNNPFQLIVQQLIDTQTASHEQLHYLLRNAEGDNVAFLQKSAFEIRKEKFQNTVFFRGLIEISNYCRCHCLYCGIRSSNRAIQRFRLTDYEIIDCCTKGYHLGYRTFVLQGGEDPHFTDDRLAQLIRSIKEKCPNCALTLSLGERSDNSYKILYNAGADRYLLRHETAHRQTYEELHPHASFENRRHCLQSLKKIGYQTGAGFLVGLPGYQIENYINDLLYLKELEPEMVGIGPFIPQKESPMSHCPAGSIDLTLTLLSIVRLLLPDVLLPATTALATIDPEGRTKGFRAGANVIMPNLSPFENRSKYALYDGKKFTDNEAGEELESIKKQILYAGFTPIMERADHTKWKRIETI